MNDFTKAEKIMTYDSKDFLAYKEEIFEMAVELLKKDFGNLLIEYAEIIIYQYGQEKYDDLIKGFRNGEYLLARFEDSELEAKGIFVKDV